MSRNEVANLGVLEMKRKSDSSDSNDVRSRAEGLPRLYTLKEAAAAFGSSGVTVSSLRREVQAGRLKAVRTRPGRNAKILIAEPELLRWLRIEAGARHFVHAEVAND